MNWSLLQVTSVIILFLWSVLSYAILNFSSLEYQKDAQINALIIKNKFESEANNYTSIINEYISSWYSLYQVKTYDDLIYNFKDMSSNRSIPKWIVFQSWTIWENKKIAAPLWETAFDKIYLVTIKDRKVTIIRVL